MDSKRKWKRAGLIYFGALFLLIPSAALAYIDPSVTSYAVQALAGVVVAAGAFFAAYGRKTRKRILKALGIDDVSQKPQEPKAEIWMEELREESKAKKVAFEASQRAATEGTKTQRLRYTRRIRQSFLPVFSFLFVLLGFGPADLYMTNRGSEEFWFQYTDLLVPLLVIFVLSMVVLLVVLLVLPQKGYRVALALITAAAVLMYLQGKLLPNDYGALNGKQIDWWSQAYTIRFIYNTAIWVGLILAAVLTAVKKWDVFRKAAQLIMICLLAVQISSLVILGMSKGETRQTEKADAEFLSTKNEFILSGQQNTLVFVLDAFDSEYMCELLEEYPEEIRESFHDFVFYHNTSGGATRTKYGIPFILTGKTNDTGDTYGAYLSEAFQQSVLIKTLREREIDTGFYTNSAYIDCSQTAAIDNLSTEEIRPSSGAGLAGSVLKMTAFKYIPQLLKPLFWMYSFEFDQWKGSAEELQPYIIDDILFHDTLTSQGLSVSKSGETFRFYHLMGTHGPFTMNENIEKITDGYGTVQQQAIGCLRILEEYLRQMKALGIYDQATIVILADHGDRDYEQNPLFMVKAPYSDAEFRVSDLRLTYADLPEMLTDAIHGKLVIENSYEKTGTRYCYNGYEENSEYVITEYATEGDAYDPGSYYKTGKLYTYQKNNYQYEPGTKLFFGENFGATAKQYCTEGFSEASTEFTWTCAKEAVMRFETSEIRENLKLTFDFVNEFDEIGSQRCYISANDTLVGSFVAEKPGEKTFILPGECLTENNTLILRFSLPDAQSPFENGKGVDHRILGLAFHSICIEQTEERPNLEEQLEVREISQ